MGRRLHLNTCTLIALNDPAYSVWMATGLVRVEDGGLNEATVAGMELEGDTFGGRRRRDRAGCPGARIIVQVAPSIDATRTPRVSFFSVTH